MNDPDLAGLALARAGRAQNRETRALEHAREANRMAEDSTDPEVAEAYRLEAGVYSRAATIHHKAMEVHTKHARDHS